MARRIAVIDLGSNTFHLLIADKDEYGLSTVFKKRAYVSLCEGGGQVIKGERMKAGLEVLADFKEVLKKYGVEKFRMIGTAVLRNAINRAEFIEKAESVMGSPIEVIDGVKEAELIYNGVRLFGGFEKDSHVVIDIGGGSTEIIINKNNCIQLLSFDFGIGQLNEIFHKEDPITVERFNELKSYVFSNLNSTGLEKHYGINTMVGSAGSFEILLSLYRSDFRDYGENTSIPVEWARVKSHQVALMNIAQREMLANVPKERLRYLSVGFATINVFIEYFKPCSIIVSPFALKEGVLSEM